MDKVSGSRLFFYKMINYK